MERGRSRRPAQLDRVALAHVGGVRAGLEPRGRRGQRPRRLGRPAVLHHRALAGLELDRAARGAQLEAAFECRRAGAAHRAAQHQVPAAAHLALADPDLDHVTAFARELGAALLEHGGEHRARGDREQRRAAERHRHPRELEARSGVAAGLEAVAGAQLVAFAQALPGGLGRQLRAVELAVEPRQGADPDPGALRSRRGRGRRCGCGRGGRGLGPSRPDRDQDEQQRRERRGERARRSPAHFAPEPTRAAGRAGFLPRSPWASRCG